VPEELVGEFVRRCTGKFAKKKTPPEIFAGLPGVIRELSERNILLVVTGNTTGNVNAFLAHHGLQGCIRMVYGVDLPGSKAEKIKTAKSQFNTGEELTFFVGDSLSDIHAARDADVKSVAVSWGHQNLELLVRCGPDLIVHSPMELLDIFG
jgi:phosphoglycolate phosphatase-like HAD superfamily hydrolase